MIRNLSTRLIFILAIATLAIWVDFSDEIRLLNPINDVTILQRDVIPRLGLDLRGGLQVLLEADLPIDAEISADNMETARQIVENRTNALGVAENSIQVAGDRRIVGEFPGIEDADSVLATIQQTGLLEFVDTGDQSMPEGMSIQTDFSTGVVAPTEIAPVATDVPTPGDGTTPETPAAVYHTVMTGKDLKDVSVNQTEVGQYVIRFVLTSEGGDVFSDYTTANVNKFLTLVLDKRVISSPRINEPITGGEGSISGSFTYETANALAIQLRYGSLPIPLKIVETRIIGPTLGEDSLQKSLTAGIIGMIIVVMFMLLYYRLPGLVADISILFYAAITFAIFKWFHFTLTLPGIAGFLLSTGAALDANILIFERFKEELRNGRSLATAVDQGWTRAWSSIRDSNIATLITSGILFWFGSTFGATIVKGFSLTLAIGVMISLFTAIFVSRSLLAFVLRYFKPDDQKLWFGL
ncbi:MAG: protein translocase subunit SecD [Anaerolineales bacterium]|nr:protein translocase subunit SecD [Anaerolineales bacterium]